MSDPIIDIARLREEGREANDGWVFPVIIERDTADLLLDKLSEARELLEHTASKPLFEPGEWRKRRDAFLASVKRDKR